MNFTRFLGYVPAYEPVVVSQKFGVLVPNRVFVGGISNDTTGQDLNRIFSAYGIVKSANVIVDNDGVGKGYGFVTFETQEDALRVQADNVSIMDGDRKLNIAPAIRKHYIMPPRAIFYCTTPGPNGPMVFDQYAPGFPPVPDFQGTGFPAMYGVPYPYNPCFQYYSVPVNAPIWPQEHQDTPPEQL